LAAVPFGYPELFCDERVKGIFRLNKAENLSVEWRQIAPRGPQLFLKLAVGGDLRRVICRPVQNWILKLLGRLACSQVIVRATHRDMAHEPAPVLN